MTWTHTRGGSGSVLAKSSSPGRWSGTGTSSQAMVAAPSIWTVLLEIRFDFVEPGVGLKGNNGFLPAQVIL